VSDIIYPANLYFTGKITIMKSYATVDEYILGNDKWREALIILREIISSTELKEEVKWGAPSYSYNSKNVIGLGAFKNFITIWFHQGASLRDPHQKLINAQEGRTKALRQMRFTSIEEINPEVIVAYIEEAIQNQKDGKKIKFDKTKPIDIPQELQIELNKNKELTVAFDIGNDNFRVDFLY